MARAFRSARPTHKGVRLISCRTRPEPERQLTARHGWLLADWIHMVDERHEVRRLIADVARAVDRRLAVDVREPPGCARRQLILPHRVHLTPAATPVAPALV